MADAFVKIDKNKHAPQTGRKAAMGIANRHFTPTTSAYGSLGSHLTHGRWNSGEKSGHGSERLTDLSR